MNRVSLPAKIFLNGAAILVPLALLLGATSAKRRIRTMLRTMLEVSNWNWYASRPDFSKPGRRKTKPTSASTCRRTEYSGARTARFPATSNSPSSKPRRKLAPWKATASPILERFRSATGTYLLTYKAEQYATCNGEKVPVHMNGSSIYILKAGHWQAIYRAEVPLKNQSSLPTSN